MLLYTSSLFTLNYDPTTDILSADWPDVKDFLVPEVNREIIVLIDNIKHYDVKKLLIDTSKAKIEVSSAEYQDFIAAFAVALKSTRLQKFARIGTNNPEREKITEQAKNSSGISEVMEFRSFATKAEALDWLLT
jgi:hypothetical protein